MEMCIIDYGVMTDRLNAFSQCRLRRLHLIPISFLNITNKIESEKAGMTCSESTYSLSSSNSVRNYTVRRVKKPRLSDSTIGRCSFLCRIVYIPLLRVAKIIKPVGSNRKSRYNSLKSLSPLNYKCKCKPIPAYIPLACFKALSKQKEKGIITVCKAHRI